MARLRSTDDFILFYSQYDFELGIALALKIHFFFSEIWELLKRKLQFRYLQSWFLHKSRKTNTSGKYVQKYYSNGWDIFGATNAY